MAKEKYIFNGKEAEVKVLKYEEPENIAILVLTEDEDGNISETVLTVNPSIRLKEDEVPVKIYSGGENFNYVDFLVGYGFIEPVCQYAIPSGFVQIPVFKATDKTLKQQAIDLKELEEEMEQE